MQLPARARCFLSVLALSSTFAACSHPPRSSAPALPWLAEVTSIDTDGGLSRCAGGSCEPLTQRALIAVGSSLRVERGARAILAVDESTEVRLRDGAEVELAQEGGEHVLRTVRGRVLVVRREGAPSGAPNVVVIAGGRALVVTGAVTLDVRAAAEGGTSTAVVERGHATVRGSGAEAVLTTGQGAKWRGTGAIEPYARWSAAGDDEGDAPTRSGGAPRGLGTMTARVPGTEEVVSGVRLAMHHVSAEVRDGFARTTVEEEFENETSRTLEGRFLFPLPPDASISRLALWVGDELVEGEIVDKPLATRIFKTIVDDTVRPRDPALLEMKAGSTVSLKVFPIPAKGKRRVILAYDQALSQRGDRVRYVVPLSLGADRATTIDDFAVSVVVKDSAAALGSAMTAGYDAALHVDEQGIVASYSAKRFAPASDFVLRYSRTTGDAASLSWSMGPKEGSAAPAGYFALRVRADVPEGFAHRRFARSARAFVIDTSHSQSADTIDASVRVVKAALEGLDPEDRFVLLACDSACASYPEDALARAGDDGIAAASTWLQGRSAAGSSDVAGALLTAAERLTAEGGGQVMYLGDGVATSGELGASAIVERVAPAFQGLDAHFVGVGHSLDEGGLAAIASAVAGTYERFATGDPIAERAAAIARALDAPVLRDAKLILPQGAFDVLPKRLPRVRLGQEIQVVGRFRPAPEAKGDTVPASVGPEDTEEPAQGPLREVRLTGQVAGAPYEAVRSLDWSRALAAPSPAVHALWARARIAALEDRGGPEATREIVRLSTVHHVLSRATALLVLENERMFVETGVRAAIDRVLASDPVALERGTDLRADSGSQGRGSASGSRAKDAESSGVTGARSRGSAPSGSWGAAASESASASGHMWGDTGSSFGTGGLGLHGIGEGGGGLGQGIGLGTIGTIGHGAGEGDGIGFGSGHRRLPGTHSATAPKVRGGAASVSGRIPPEVIQRIIRQRFGSFRACYETGLRTNPDLQGRVSVRFVINSDGSVGTASNGGSDLPDTTVVSCIVRAFAGMIFPQPEGGIVTVTYPIQFAPTDPPASPSAGGSSTSSSPAPAASPSASSAASSASSAATPWKSSSSSLSTSWRSPVGSSWPRWAPNPPLDAPVVVHRAPEEAPASSDDAALAKLLAKVAEPGAPRSAHQALVRKLLARGRFDDAFAAASRYVGLDPDHEVALELYAEAAATTGRPRVAVMALDAQVEGDPTRVDPHRRAAAAFEATGDERRACAHFRALASLPSADDTAVYHALRCRARLGERTAVVAMARALPKPGALVAKLITALESGSAPPFEPSQVAGSFEARVTCSGEAAACPVPVLVGPTGNVVSPWTPVAACSRGALSLASVTSGTYRTLVAGDVPASGAELVVRVLGQSKTVALLHSGTRVALATTVTMPDTSFGMN